MNTKQKTLKNSTRLLALFLSMLFLFVGCGGEDRPYEQIFDETSKTGNELRISGLQESGESVSRSAFITDFEAYQSVRDELKASNIVELPKMKEKAFEDNLYLLIVRAVPQIRDYKYQVKDILVEKEMLTVQYAIEEDDQLMAAQMGRDQIVLIRLDKELVQDVEKVTVKTEYMDETDHS